MTDVLVVGAGPAGTVAATVLARRGVRVCIVDRARFPREKLCGDTINPGTVALLRRLGMAAQLEARGLPIRGMIVTGADGVAVEAAYPDGLPGRALLRRELDWLLLQHALDAGASFEPSVIVRRALRAGARGAVRGIVVNDGVHLRAPVVIAADGRRSTLAFDLDLAAHPARPRRWAIGGYFEGVAGTAHDDLYGEMHLRRHGYLGVAPVPGGLTNVCLVGPWDPRDRSAARARGALGDPGTLLRRALAEDDLLRDRFVNARLVRRPVVLGPLAVDVNGKAIDGLLLAGDAAGFVDPMTGDGLRFAARGGELAAAAALEALEHGWHGVHARLVRARRIEFGVKLRFNRTLRGVVSSPAAVRVGEAVASVCPAVVRALVRLAGDCA